MKRSAALFLRALGSACVIGGVSGLIVLAGILIGVGGVSCWLAAAPINTRVRRPGKRCRCVCGRGGSASAIAVIWSRNGPTRSPSWALCRNGLSGFTV